MLISSTVSSPRPSTPLLLLFSNKTPRYPLKTAQSFLGSRNRRRIWTPQISTGDSSSSSPEGNQTVTVAPLQTREVDGDYVQSQSAPDTVRSYYEAVNGRDLASVENLISDDCVYEDLIFPRPFVGRKAVLEFLKNFVDSIGTDLQFTIDDISDGDSSAVGVTWHLEWKGRPFPFSKGCSFYRLKVLDGKRQIIYGRDSVEPAIKPGETALAWRCAKTSSIDWAARCKITVLASARGAPITLGIGSRYKGRNLAAAAISTAGRPAAVTCKLSYPMVFGAFIWP